ncbi:hypothetical protein HSR122_2719 [Halapricum desulfuricans]|uniref:Uncharacterized protein n=1 Tax=Halapricum desulfuricans TaxID=2841257 RepID=A0A897NGJ7_9EURY|nr:hypothetical protein HSR122_2719 [Halapricum desulfuricans]
MSVASGRNEIAVRLLEYERRIQRKVVPGAFALPESCRAIV